MPSLINATFWSSIHRFGGLAIGFVSNIVLARILCPEDYGILGLIMVFIGIADVLVDGGLGNALIQKKDIDEKDTSTVFTSNLIISFCLFVIIIFSAPAIASFVNIEHFEIFLRVEAITVLLRAFYVVHFSLMNREMEFKRLAQIQLSTNFFSTIITIALAYCGIGVWSLILKSIFHDVLLFILYYYYKRVKLSFRIYKASFKQLFSFGMFVAIANIVESVYSNILSLILGKKFSVKDLGYYNQAHALEQIPVYSITSILNQVFFPFLSKEQDDLDKMKTDVLKSLRVMSFFVYPLMFFLICFAKPLIVLLYSEKWLPAVPFFQILCTVGFTNFLYHLNRSILKAIGKTKYLFYLQVLICIVGLTLIILSIPFGIYALVVSTALNSMIGMLITLYLVSRLIKFSVFTQLKAVSMNFVLSSSIAVAVYLLFSFFTLNIIVELLLGFIAFAGLYLALQCIFGGLSTSIIIPVLKNNLYKKKGKGEVEK